MDKDKLKAIIEAVLETTHIVESELMVYRMLVQMLCRERGLGPEKIQELVDRARQRQLRG